jgi:sensor histidine kinase YesM
MIASSGKRRIPYQPRLLPPIALAGLPFIPQKLTPGQWGRVGAIWTLATCSIATQFYFNLLPEQPQTSWLLLFAKQFPLWCLCALLTPFVMGVYRVYPLDSPRWKPNLLRQVLAALCLLPLFSLLRMLATYVLFNPALFRADPLTQFSNFMSQLSWDAGIYAFIVVILFADKTYQSRKQQELSVARLELRNTQLQQQLIQAQLEALKLQLSPHFLFNTLHTVGALIRSQQYQAAVQVNARLGEFLRKTLASEDRQFVSLAEELDFVDLYLDIESVRFSDRLTVSKHIDPESLPVGVPYLILQPLVENAVKHGIARHRQARHLRITARREAGYVNILIYNDVSTLPTGWELASHAGLGLRNVQSRLQKIYVLDFAFCLTDQPSGGGVTASLRLPLRLPAHAHATH